MLSKREPFEYPISVVPGEVINFQVKVKEDKKNAGKKINACIHIHYKTDHLGRGKSTNVACSDVGTIILDGDSGGIDGNSGVLKSVSLVAPEFRVTNAVKSVVYITTDSFDGINIGEVNVVKGGTFVGGKGEGVVDGFIGKDPLVPGLNGGVIPSVAGLNADALIRLMKTKIRSGRIDVVCEGLMLGHSGFAKAMRNVTYGLDRSGCNVKSVILDGDCIGSSKTDIGKRILTLNSNSAVGAGGGFYISMNFPLGVRHHPGFYSIAYVMFETVDFPKVFVDYLKNSGMNEIWTPSTFCKDSMVRAGLGGIGGEGVHVMHLGVDTSMFSKEFADEPRYIPGNLGGELAGKFKFLTTCGYSERKGVSVLIRAFNRAFAGKDHDKVALYFKGGWYPGPKAEGEMNAIINSMGIPANERPMIVYDFNIYSDEVLASLYKGCDCFVLPSRGEGWSLPMCEAMSMGLPTIGTRWSGNLDFMTDENSYLINIDGFAPEPRCNWVTGYYAGQKFAVPNEDHLVELMRHVYEHQDEGIRKGKIARDWMVKNFDWKVSCAKMKARLVEIVNS